MKSRKHNAYKKYNAYANKHNPYKSVTLNKIITVLNRSTTNARSCAKVCSCRGNKPSIESLLDPMTIVHYGTDAGEAV